MLLRSAAGLAALGGLGCGQKPQSAVPAGLAPFKYRVSVGWLRDLASQPTPDDPWPCITWDDQLQADQRVFLGAENELGLNFDCTWGLFRARNWPVPFENVIDNQRAARLKAYVDEAHGRGIKVLAGLGVYSWGFEEIIRKVPDVSAGGGLAMCLQSTAAWDWMRRVIDFHLQPEWGLDGVSLQSADQGKCECPVCSKLSPAEYHAEILTRCADYIRKARPDWVIGQASWGLRVDDPAEYVHIQRISRSVDYMVEVRELSAKSGRRPEIIAGLACAFGSLGGVFLEPPQHWERQRWFVPCGLGSARSLSGLRKDGGLACEYFYRPFANPGEEVSWRCGAKILSSPQTTPEESLSAALTAVYGVEGSDNQALSDWYTRSEEAYFSRIEYRPGDGDIMLEPLIWKQNPAAAGPPVYLDRLAPTARTEYAIELRHLKEELGGLPVPRRGIKDRTLACIDGTLADIARSG